jgi:hypothetical protein
VFISSYLLRFWFVFLTQPAEAPQTPADLSSAGGVHVQMCLFIGEEIVPFSKVDTHTQADQGTSSADSLVYNFGADLSPRTNNGTPLRLCDLPHETRIGLIVYGHGAHEHQSPPSQASGTEVLGFCVLPLVSESGFLHRGALRLSLIPPAAAEAGHQAKSAKRKRALSIGLDDQALGLSIKMNEDLMFLYHAPAFDSILRPERHRGSITVILGPRAHSQSHTHTLDAAPQTHPQSQRVFSAGALYLHKDYKFSFGCVRVRV